MIYEARGVLLYTVHVNTIWNHTLFWLSLNISCIAEQTYQRNIGNRVKFSTTFIVKTLLSYLNCPWCFNRICWKANNYEVKSSILFIFFNWIKSAFSVRVKQNLNNSTDLKTPETYESIMAHPHTTCKHMSVYCRG